MWTNKAIEFQYNITMRHFLYLNFIDRTVVYSEESKICLYKLAKSKADELTIFEGVLMVLICSREWLLNLQLKFTLAR